MPGGASVAYLIICLIPQLGYASAVCQVTTASYSSNRILVYIWTRMSTQFWLVSLLDFLNCLLTYAVDISSFSFYEKIEIYEILKLKKVFLRMQGQVSTQHCHHTAMKQWGLLFKKRIVATSDTCHLETPVIATHLSRKMERHRLETSLRNQPINPGVIYFFHMSFVST